ncbi:hypothetical protein HGRIS_013145 [Hohenbuehelia grisea]|uniref:t-SNARE coiled-coil homology domain-containing protein n=1 Tax=Hohenbuehelia grisea TaxID=104357 RepID=A0ABR3IUH8_9AGAR
MAMDRLAAARARRQEAQPTQGPATHELNNVQANGYSGANNGAAGGGTNAFLSEITSIQDGIEQLSANVKQISDFHSRSINAVGVESQQDTALLDNLTSETRTLSNALKDRIKKLEFETASSTGHDIQIRRNRLGLVRQNFLEALQQYQQVEMQYRAKAKQRVERQFKIVKPDATPEEVAAVVDNADGAGDQIFAQALTSSTRYGDSRTAYHEVQERHQDILRMEQTLAELAVLFNDMATLVEQQDAVIDSVEQTAVKVEGDAEAGGKNLDEAVRHARAWRKKKWICFFICLIIIIIIALAVGLKFGLNK